MNQAVERAGADRGSSAALESHAPPDCTLPKVAAFDVFGTVVDWHGTIVREVESLGLGVNGSDFALAWRDLYRPAMAKVREGRIGWTSIDVLHRQNLEEILRRFGIRHLSEAEKRSLNRVWHRLEPWPDAVAGLGRLRRGMMICTLSNGNLALLANMAKASGLPWDLIVSAENFRRYKPDPASYQGLCALWELSGEELLFVAAHKDDLDAAHAATGCRTAFVCRPQEFGPRGRSDLQRESRFTYHASDFHDLAHQLQL